MGVRRAASGTSCLGAHWLCHYQHHRDHSINRWPPCFYASVSPSGSVCFATLQTAILVPLVWLEKNDHNG